MQAEAELNMYRNMVAEVEGTALTPERSRDFIYGIIKELEG